MRLGKRGGRADSGTIGRKIQRECKNRLGITDVWRNNHPEGVNITWSNGVENKSKLVETRIGKILIDKTIIDRFTSIDITKIKVSDHDSFTWTMVTEIKGKQPRINKCR